MDDKPAADGPRLAGYELDEALWHSARSQVWRGRRSRDQKAVILKILNEDPPSPERLGRFRREYELTQRLAVDGTSQPLALESAGRGAMLVLADTGATSCDKLLAAKQALTPLEATRIALGLARILEGVHDRGLIHKDINPSNVLRNRRRDRVELIDFELASELGQEDAAAQLGALEGTLAYIAPEQTGRMNRGVDYRADFYALGASLVELLAGRPPFTADDPLALVHSHIAVAPPELSELAPAVPAQLGRIVARLLAKTPEARYQSATALAADLAAVHEALAAGTQVPSFTPGAHDIPQTLQIPEKLYGRGEAIATLTAGFDAAAQGGRAATLVTGNPGIGKSALVGELHKPVTAQSGYFLAGKFDPFQRERPYSALIQAFGDLIRQILATSEARLAGWRAAIQAALGPNGGVLAQLIPEIVEIIGEQPQPAALDAQAERNRFNDTLSRFVGAIVGPEHPVVLFLDDLQWADTASLGLLRTLLLDPELGYLYVVGAYRHTELDEGHPLAKLIAELGEQGAAPAECHLAGLAEADVAQLVADTVNTDPESCAELAQQAYSKTLGNPFFLERLLARWAEEGLLWPDREAGRWRWDSAGIAASAVADNVVALTAEKLYRLPPPTRETLAQAAVLGNQVDLANLAIVARARPGELVSRLWPAIEADVIRPIDEGYKYVGEAGHSGHGWLRFRHDRVQQAALELLDRETYEQAQLSAGRLLLDQIEAPETDERLFEALGHLNAVTGLITAGAERDKLVQLNLVAGQRAQRAAAYGPAQNFLQTGLALLGDTAWEAVPELAHSFAQRSAETAFMLGELDRMREHTDTILARVPDAAATAPARELRIQAHVFEGEPGAAMREGLAALAALGVALPEQPGKAATLMELVRTRRLLKRCDIAGQVEQGELRDPQLRATMSLLAALVAPAYIARPNLFPILVMRQVQLSFRYGNHASSCYAFAAYGLLLWFLGRPVSEADQFGRLAQNLLARLDAERYRCATNFVVCYFIDAWQMALTDIAEQLPRIHDEGLRTGDLQFAAYAAHCHGITLTMISTPLSEAEAIMARNRRSILKIGQHASADILASYQQYGYQLYHDVSEPAAMQGPHVDEADQVARFRRQANYTAVFGLAMSRVLLSYHYDALDEAGPWVATVRETLEGVRSTPGYIRGLVMDIAVSAARLAEGHAANTRRARRDLRKQLARLHRIMGKINNPETFRSFVALAEGELARAEGRFRAALAAFQTTVVRAEAQGFHEQAALGHERVARLHEDNGLPRLAMASIEEALSAYSQWEAHGKIAYLRRRYQKLAQAGPSAAASGSRTTGSATASVTAEGDQQLDLEAVVRAAQTISQEIRPAQLAATLMEVVGQTAGATHGVLLLGEREADLHVQALLDSDKDPSVTVLVDRPEAAPPAAEVVPLAAVRYGLRRREPVAVDEPAEDRTYSYDPYIQSYGPRSILCLPLVNQGRVTGVLYVEHRHLVGAFPASRTTILGLLSAQMAVSLENAQLYSDMEAQVANRTRELEASTEALRREKEETERAHRTIEDSLETARRMQRAALPEADAAALNLADLAVWWEPRDHVGGDFYRLRRSADGRFTAILLMDCTGHGVPGALISFVASSAADQVLSRDGPWDPPAMLAELDERVRAQLHGQARETVADDGLEAGLAVVDTATGAVAFAGVGIHLFVADGGQLRLLPGTRGGLGYQDLAPPTALPGQHAEAKSGRSLIMATDGVLEQPGGPKGLQLGRGRFARLVADTRDCQQLAPRLERIQQAVLAWRGGTAQRDDVTVIAFTPLASEPGSGAVS